VQTVCLPAAAAGSTLAAVPTAAPGDEQGNGGARPRSSSRAMSPSPPDGKELGLMIDSSDLGDAFSPASGTGKNKMKDEPEEGEGQDLWPVPIDTSLRIGDPTNIDGLFSHQPSSDATRARPTANAENFFGLMPARTTLTQLRKVTPQHSIRQCMEYLSAW